MLTEEQIAELDAKHGRTAMVRSPGRGPDKKGGDPVPPGTDWEVIFRKPRSAEYKRFRAANHNPALIADAQETLARQTVVYPSPEAFNALLEEWPAIPEAASKAFAHLMGLTADESSK
jgi:hypothetical protein